MAHKSRNSGTSWQTKAATLVNNGTNSGIQRHQFSHTKAAMLTCKGTNSGTQRLQLNHIKAAMLAQEVTNSGTRRLLLWCTATQETDVLSWHMLAHERINVGTQKQQCMHTMAPTQSHEGSSVAPT
ncbi:hypothetical protein Fot_37559 [Forsythia ovata]|uniref:Uncharacterized protein n=1 Tax=Forsythia ovata TaxID=205694 RepID=A0ABD1RZF9_9LAMI